jgi:virginiamycin B lyase
VRWPKTGLALSVVLVAAVGCTDSEAPAPGGAAPADSGGGSASALAGAAVRMFPVPASSRPHDVAPAADGGVWFTAQGAGYLGHLDAESGQVTQVPLGAGSRPHGVIVGADGAAWVTDGGLNAVVRVDAATRAVRRFPLPADRPAANLNTAAFDGRGVLWFTGQAGVYGRLDPATGQMRVHDAPGGPGPYGIAATPSGEVYYASLAGNHIARIDVDTGAAIQIRPPTEGQGARRVWSDSQGHIWVSEYNAGQVGRYDPTTGQWREWRLPGAAPKPYAVYVDDQDKVWLSDFDANTVVRFDPATETFATVPVDGGAGNVRQILGRPGEVWCPASSRDLLFVITSGARPRNTRRTGTASPLGRHTARPARRGRRRRLRTLGPSRSAVRDRGPRRPAPLRRAGAADRGWVVGCVPVAHEPVRRRLAG